MPMIAFAALVVVANLTDAGTAVNSEYFRPWVDGGTGDGTRHSTICNDRTVVIIDRWLKSSSAFIRRL